MTSSADNPGVAAPPPLLYGGAFVLILVFRWFRPAPIYGHGAAFWHGLVLAMLGVGVVAWGRRTMKAGSTNVNPARSTTVIVAAGPFRSSRNSLYLALMLLYLGLTLMFQFVVGLAELAPLLLVIFLGMVSREERYLEQKFGDTYRQYRSKVRRYI